ncbi:hypothetical protein YC2023_105263 [Brassica napus]
MALVRRLDQQNLLPFREIGLPFDCDLGSFMESTLIRFHRLFSSFRSGNEFSWIQSGDELRLGCWSLQLGGGLSFFALCFKRSGWKTTKEDFIRELRSAYAIAKLRKTGYSKKKLYIEALELYKEELAGDSGWIELPIKDKIQPAL